MNLVVHFKDGESVSLKNWQNWNVDLDGKKDIIDLFLHYKQINKEISFTNPTTGENLERSSQDVKSIEIVFA